MKYSILIVAIVGISFLASGELSMTVEALEAAPARTRIRTSAIQDAAPGARILESSCFGCHELSGLEDYGYAEADWHDLLQRMIGYGAVLSNPDYETLVAYLVGGAGASTVEPDDTEAVDADLAEGANLFESACTTCHDVSGVTDYPGIYGEQDYRDMVDNMIAYGASLNAEQAELVVQYLTQTYGLDAAAEVPVDDTGAEADEGVDLVEGARLFETACTTCHDVSGVTDYPGTYNESEFREMISRMLDYGTQLTATEAETVLQYLVVTYGRD